MFAGNVEIFRMKPGMETFVLQGMHLFDSPLSESAVRAYLADARNLLLFAYEREVPIGFVRGTLLLQLDSDRTQMFLYEIGVMPSFRRKGVGKALIRELLDFCRKNEVEEVFVLTSPEDPAAVRLYTSTGAGTETPSDRMYVYRLTDAPTPPS